MKREKVCEAKVPETLWFHGSRFDDADKLKINPPSPENIFFVAKNLMYAKYYADQNQHKSKESTSIYVCSLKDNRHGLKLFNISDDSGRKTKKEFGEFCVLESLRFAGMHLRNAQDMFSNIIAFISDYCKPIIESGYDKEELKKIYVFKDVKSWVIETFIKELPNFLDKVGLTEKDILTKNNAENGAVVRKAYCEFWKKIGLNAFDTVESKPTGISDCLGIFDVSALDSIYAISIPYNIVKKYDNAHQLNNDTAIKEYLKNYIVKDSMHPE